MKMLTWWQLSLGQDDDGFLQYGKTKSQFRAQENMGYKAQKNWRQERDNINPVLSAGKHEVGTKRGKKNKTSAKNGIT